MNAAWDRFAEDVAELGETVENAPFNKDQKTAAAGYRHIARLLATFLAEFTDFRNPEYPQFSRFPNSVARIGWDNPDSLYLAFPVRGDHSYRLRGNASNFDLVTINVYSGMLGHTPVRDIRTISSIASDNLDIDENGDFVLTLSASPAEGDWLRLEPDAYIVLIRRLVSDWENTDEGLWEVLNLTTLGKGSPRPTPESVGRSLDDAVTQARALRELLTIAHRITFQLALRPNEASEPARTDPNLPMADPFQTASRGYFRLREDEALLVEAPVADCRYASIQLGNPWMESLDYASRQASLNHRTRHVDADGRVRYVISIRDPGVHNWLDTAGWAEGSFCAPVDVLRRGTGGNLRTPGQAGRTGTPLAGGHAQSRSGGTQADRGLAPGRHQPPLRGRFLTGGAPGAPPQPLRSMQACAARICDNSGGMTWGKARRGVPEDESTRGWLAGPAPAGVRGDRNSARGRAGFPPAGAALLRRQGLGGDPAPGEEGVRSPPCRRFRCCTWTRPGKFPEAYEYRDRIAAESGMKLLVHVNREGQGPRRRSVQPRRKNP